MGEKSSMKRITIAYVASAPFTAEILQILKQFPQILIAGVWTKSPKPQGRGRMITSSPLEQVCAQLQIPLFLVESINAKSCVDQWKDFGLDAALVVAHGEILLPQLYTIPRYGTFNIHFSLLPQHRGASPIASAILHGDQISGITIQKIAQRCDAGDIVDQRSFSILKDDAHQVLIKSIQACKSLLSSWVDALARDAIVALPQDLSRVTFCTKISKEHGRIFPQDSAQMVDRKFRAFVGWPGVFIVTADNQRIKLLSISQINLDHFSLDYCPDNLSGHATSPSKNLAGHLVCDKLTSSVKLILVDGAFLVQTLQLEGKPSVFARDFINGRKCLDPISFV